MSQSAKKQAPSTGSVAALAWPIAMNAVFLQSIIVIDTVLVTPLGVQSLAALGLASSFVGILNGMLLAFAAGTQLLLAQAFGAENLRLQRQWFYSGLAINLIIAALALLFIFVFVRT